MSIRGKAILATLSAQVIWGIAGPLVKTVLADIPPLSLLFFRCLLVSVCMFPIFEFKLLPKQPKMTSEDKRNLFLTGFSGVFLNVALYFIGQNLTTVIDAWVISTAGVVFVIAYSFFFHHERLQKIVYLGIGLAFLGTLAVIGDGLIHFGKGGMVGNLLMAASTLSAALSYFHIKSLMSKFSPLIIVYYSFLISLVFSLPLFVWEFIQNPYWISHVSTKSWLIVLYLSFGSSIGAYYLSNLGLKHLSPSLSSTIGYVGAIIAVGLSIIFLGEHPTTYFFIGTAIIIVGLLLAETRHKKPKVG